MPVSYTHLEVYKRQDLHVARVGIGHDVLHDLLLVRFIKVDIAIIRGIDTDPDKQQIVPNIVAYAHQMCIRDRHCGVPPFRR